MRPPVSKANDKVSNPRALEENSRVGRIDLARAIAQIAARGRRRQDATSFLDRIGFRNATVVIDHLGSRTAWRVPSANFGLAHYDVHSVLSGDIAVASSRGVWRLNLHAEESEQTRQVRLRLSLRDLFPQTIGEAFPGLAVLSTFRLPLSGLSDLTLSSSGELLAGKLDLALGSGRLQLPWIGGQAPRLQSGELKLRYRRGQQHIELAPSRLRWAESEMTFVGSMAQRANVQSGSVWDYSLRSIKGVLRPGRSHKAVALKSWQVAGSILPVEGIISIDSLAANAGGKGMTLKGRMYTGLQPGLAVSGQFGTMPAHSLMALWPTFVGAGARDWLLRNVQSGQVRSGSFAMRLGVPAGSRQVKPGDNSGYSIDVEADVSNMRLRVDRSLPSALAPRTKIRVKNDVVKVDVPEAAFDLGRNRSFAVKDLGLNVVNIYEPSVDGVVTFKLSGKVKDALDSVAALDDAEVREAAKLRDRISGQLDGQFSVTVPFVRTGQLPKPKIIGQLRVSDGRMQQAWRGLDITGSSLIVDVGGDGLVAKGQLLLGGVPVQMSWQRFFNAADDRQPPVRLKAKLDETDRKQLGFKINHILQGPVGLDVTLQPQPPQAAGAGASAKIRVDLTDADVTIESLAWRKPVGRRAVLDFDVEPTSGQTANLRNVRLVGEGISVRGEATVGEDGHIRSFDIPDFTIDVITRLQIKGELRKGNVWRVSARGPTYEGREFFRTLFAAGRLKGRRRAKKQPGLDLDVRIDNVLGFWDTRLSNLKLDLSKRNGKIVALSARGKLSANGVLNATVKRGAKQRQLIATSNDAGATFKLIGFYPNAEGGRMRSVIDLDEESKGERRGVLSVRKFRIFGDEVLSEVLQSRSATGGNRRRRQASVTRQQVQFDWMRVPFAVGKGQFIIGDAELRGPLLGVVLCGRADFASRRMRLGGTYVPLQGLNAAVGAIPGLGQLLAGPKGEGVLGITFQVAGAMQRPQVVVNPLSLVAPGIFREMFQVTCPRRLAAGIDPKIKQGGGEPSIGSGWSSQSPVDSAN